MNGKCQYKTEKCEASFRNFGTNLTFFAIGAGIGAALGLLFAPKAGREVRKDIADFAEKGYDQVKEAASKLGHRTAELYETAKESGGAVVDVVSARTSEIKKEVSGDAEKIGPIVGGFAHRAVGFGSSYIL